MDLDFYVRVRTREKRVAGKHPEVTQNLFLRHEFKRQNTTPETPTRNQIINAVTLVNTIYIEFDKIKST